MRQPPPNGATPVAQLASLDELESVRFRSFMMMINTLAHAWELREFHDWSKVWEYPWLWFNALSRIALPGSKILDIGSEISPMPWFLATLGAHVTLIERDPSHQTVWQELRRRLSVEVDWHIVTDERLPVESSGYDLVTSFSTIEHQGDKQLATAEVGRVLRAGGLLGISFDICEVDRGMTFPEWNGEALTMASFESHFWANPLFESTGQPPRWNVDDIDAFVDWHLRSAPHHNYTVGAALLVRASR